MTLALVIGGTRSGKSAHAERLAIASGMPVRYIATADGSDPSMRERIDAHRARRPPGWSTVEAGALLADAVGEAAGNCVLVDGLGPWIAGMLHRAGAFEQHGEAVLHGVGDEVRAAIARIAEAAAAAPGTVIVVAEEAGQGVLPADAASRAWLDLLGEATQRLARAAQSVELVVAGRVLALTNGAVPARSAPSGDRTPTRPDLTTDHATATHQSLTTDHHATTRHDLTTYDPTATDRDPATDDPAPPRDGPPADIAALRHHGDRDVRPGDADHAVNVLDGGPPEWLTAGLRAALATDLSRYPDERAAVAAIAELHGREPAEVVVTNGAAEALWLLPAALRPRLAACVHPAFTESEAALRAHGVAVVRVLRDPDNGFAIDPSALPDEADLVLVGNPASPSGSLDSAVSLRALRRPGRVVVVDEAFMDFVPGQPGTLAGERLHDVIVVRSLTKILAVPGLRVGYALAPPALADRLRQVRPPWSANTLALAALTIAAAHPAQLAAAAQRATAERADLERGLAAIAGVRLWPSVTNFCLIEVADGPALVAALRAQSIAVRPAASFPGLGPGHIRLTARDPERNTRLLGAITRALRSATADPHAPARTFTETRPHL